MPEQERTEDGIRGLLDNWPPDAHEPPPNFPTADNTSVIDALKAGIIGYVLDDDSAFPNAHEYEYFAVLALWLVVDAVNGLGWTSDRETMVSKLNETFAPPPSGTFRARDEMWNRILLEARQGIPALVESLQAAIPAGKEEGATDKSIAFSLAGSCALCAMDAVCYAEHLKATQAQAAELTQLRIEFRRQNQQVDALAEAKAKQRISVNASKAAIKKNAENHALKADVFAWYEGNMDEYASMDAAAAAIIAIKLVPLEFRTVRGYISEYRKKIRSARTP